MKRQILVKYLKARGCVIHREGGRHTVIVHPENKKSSTIPRHREIDEKLARKICRDLGLEEIGK